MTARTTRWCVVLLCGLVASAAGADESWRVRWSVPASGLWQPAVGSDLVVARSGNEVSAYRLADGRRLWRKNIGGLVTGRYVLAAGAGYVYALARTGLFVLDSKSGKITHTQPLKGATRVLFASSSVYVADSSGVKRLDASGKRLLGSTIITGTLERAEGDLVVLHRWIAKAKGPNRLSVVTLEDGSVAYEFKLLPTGNHRTAAFDQGRLIFVDHSRFDRGGKRKLYYTEADARRAKKLRDVALSSHFASSTNVNVDADRSANGHVYIASFGPMGAPATVLAYDPAQKRMLWTRSGNFAVSEIAAFRGQLWTTVRGGDARTQLVAYDAESGDRRMRLALDREPAVGAPMPAGKHVLLRTRNKLFCLGDEPVVAAEPDPTTAAGAPSESKPGWRRYRDSALGYTVEVPASWWLDKTLVRDFGKGRHAIPYVAYERSGGKKRYVASVHVLMRPAGQQDAEQLWGAVLAYWRSRASDVQIVRVRRFTVNGKKRLFGVYSFVDKHGKKQQARSLCIAHDGRAYEVRGRVSATAPSGTWRRIAQIMRSFRVD